MIEYNDLSVEQLHELVRTAHHVLPDEVGWVTDPGFTEPWLVVSGVEPVRGLQPYPTWMAPAVAEVLFVAAAPEDFPFDLEPHPELVRPVLLMRVTVYGSPIREFALAFDFKHHSEVLRCLLGGVPGVFLTALPGAPGLINGSKPEEVRPLIDAGWCSLVLVPEQLAVLQRAVALWDTVRSAEGVS